MHKKDAHVNGNQQTKRMNRCGTTFFVPSPSRSERANLYVNKRKRRSNKCLRDRSDQMEIVHENDAHPRCHPSYPKDAQKTNIPDVVQ